MVLTHSLTVILVLTHSLSHSGTDSLIHCVIPVLTHSLTVILVLTVSFTESFRY